jgi:hypothetical protein
MPIAHSHAGLIWGIILVVLSVTLYVSGIVLVKKDARSLRSKLKEFEGQAEELARLRIIERSVIAKDQYASDRESLLRTGPFLVASHSSRDDGYERISLRNIRAKEARRVRIAKLRTHDFYLCRLIPEEQFVIDRNTQAITKLQVIGDSFTEIVKRGGTHSLVVDFEDEVGRNYRQEFELKLRNDNTIEVRQGDLTLP